MVRKGTLPRVRFAAVAGAYPGGRSVTALVRGKSQHSLRERADARCFVTKLVASHDTLYRSLLPTYRCSSI